MDTTVALYARVSTDDKGQNPEVQLEPLRAYAKLRGLTVVAEYVDFLSGSKRSRPELDRMMVNAQAKKFDAVLVWKFDRFARSVIHLTTALESFKSWGISFMSITEQVDTSTPMGKLVFTILGAVAEMERDNLIERTKAGLARARAQGKRLGRPGISDKLKAKIATRIARGETPYRVAKDLKIDRHTAAKYGALPFRQASAAQVTI